jgi:hypothetical protein
MEPLGVRDPRSMPPVVVLRCPGGLDSCSTSDPIAQKQPKGRFCIGPWLSWSAPGGPVGVLGGGEPGQSDAWMTARAPWRRSSDRHTPGPAWRRRAMCWRRRLAAEPRARPTNAPSDGGQREA